MQTRSPVYLETLISVSPRHVSIGLLAVLSVGARPIERSITVTGDLLCGRKCVRYCFLAGSVPLFDSRG